MNKAILASLTIVAWSVLSPLAMAQSLPIESTQTSYLGTRTDQDSVASIDQALRRMQILREQAALADNQQTPPPAVEDPSTQADFSAISKRVAADRQLSRTQQGLTIDYLGERRSLYSVEYLDKVLSQKPTEQVSML